MAILISVFWKQKRTDSIDHCRKWFAAHNFVIIAAHTWNWNLAMTARKYSNDRLLPPWFIPFALDRVQKRIDIPSSHWSNDLSKFIQITFENCTDAFDLHNEYHDLILVLIPNSVRKFVKNAILRIIFISLLLFVW